MRIIAGRLGGQTFESPKSHKTHPMSDKVRGALFNKLGDITGLSFLDAFAGSGALGYEALSRGAASVLFIDSDRLAQECIKSNLSKLDIAGNTKLVKANCSSWSSNNPEEQFDIVLLDPPYDHLQLQAVRKIALHTRTGGICVISWPGKATIPVIDGFRTVDTSNYGDIQLVFLERIG